MRRLPPWIKVRLPASPLYRKVNETLKQAVLHTVCESARCPNRAECFSRGTATVMILGDICTRNCRFCAISHGKPLPVDFDEPKRIKQVAQDLKLKHVVVTSVTRDDLADGGAGLFAETIKQIKTLSGVTVEVLTPDFLGNKQSVKTVIDAKPEVFNHNLETVARLYSKVRPQADYERSLSVLKMASEFSDNINIKSGIIVGMGETDQELYKALKDLLNAGCRYLTLGQYLAPSKEHMPVDRFVRPEQFREYKRIALNMGFKAVASAPLVRSSYRAEEMLKPEKDEGYSETKRSSAVAIQK
jgi:lipoyl synthase